MNRFLITVVLLSGCTASSPWTLDSLASAAPGSKRLVYRPSAAHSAANVEFYCSNNQISSYISTSGRRLGTGMKVPAKLVIGSESLEEEIFLHEGKMRARLPESWTLKAIEALKEGKEVVILVGTQEQTIQPDRVSGLFEQLSKELFP